MKSLSLIYYGSDGAAAKLLAGDIRKDGGSAQLRHVYAFDGVAEPEADRVVTLPCVSDYDRTRIASAYGDKVIDGAAPVPPPPIKPTEPLDSLPINWRELDATALKATAAAVNGGRTVENKEQAVAEIEAAFLKRAPK